MLVGAFLCVLRLFLECALRVAFYVACVVVAFDSLCVWLALGLVSAICDVCTVDGQAWPVWPTVCVVFTLGTVAHVRCVQSCSRCVCGVMFSVMCCSCVERLLHSSAQKTASHACAFSPQVCNPPGGP